jgi:hypothetical protein
MEDIPALATFLVAMAVMACSWAVIRWVMKPLENAAEGRKVAIQFSLADVLCLFVPVQLQLGVIHWVMQFHKTETKAWETYLFITVLVVFCWWYLVRLLSRAGVEVAWHRCVVLVAILPIPLAVSMMVDVLLGRDKLIDEHRKLAVCGLLLAVFLLGGVLYVLGRFTRTIVASAEARRSEPPPADGQ